jgi:dTDP-4-amino-4,6-dideoxygalactose transaminase
VVLTHLSRIGIALAYRFLQLSPSDELLVPSYNCGSEIDPLLWCGAKPLYYRVDSQARIDLEDIQKRLSPKTRAVYVTHYFGWPQRLTELASWCKERELLLIEDCALALFSRGPEGPVGCIGDAAIHCFWKTLPLPNGGALVLPKREGEMAAGMKSPAFNSILHKVKPFVRNWLRHRGKEHLRPLYEVSRELRAAAKGIDSCASSGVKDVAPPEIPSYCYFDDKMIDWGISRISKGMLRQADPISIVKKRRANYRQLLEGIQSLPGICPLHDDLPDGVCPQVFPVMVSDPYHWQRSLNVHRVYPFGWWRGYHPSFSWEGFPEAVELKNRLLAFPVDQHLEQDQIRRMLESIRTVSLEIGEQA